MKSILLEITSLSPGNNISGDAPVSLVIGLVSIGFQVQLELVRPQGIHWKLSHYLQYTDIE